MSEAELVVELVNDRVLSIQYLRAFAAILVAFFHCFANSLAAPFGIAATHAFWGVDIFFVISGFVIWRTSEGKPFDGVSFARKRLTRIYPMFWIALTAWILVRLFVPDSMGGADINAATVFSSYALLPHFHAVETTKVWPILVPGWTLQMELFFYAVFALNAVMSTRLSASLIAGALACCALAGFVLHPTSAVGITATRPLLLEFAAGVILAANYRAISKWPAWLGCGLVLVACASLVMFSGVDDADWQRVFSYGIAAAMLVTGSLVLERYVRQHGSRLLETLGDASYSIYLLHTLVIGFVAVCWKRLGLPATPSGIALFASTAVMLSAGAGVLSWFFIEKPILRLLSGHRGPPAGAAAVPGEVAAS
jgi:exopolysaccharide production protein ExoZ